MRIVLSSHPEETIHMDMSTDLASSSDSTFPSLWTVVYAISSASRLLGQFEHLTQFHIKHFMHPYATTIHLFKTIIFILSCQVYIRTVHGNKTKGLPSLLLCRGLSRLFLKCALRLHPSRSSIRQEFHDPVFQADQGMSSPRKNVNTGLGNHFA